MKGAIIGDIIGSRFEFNNTTTRDFELFTKECSFTDDTICTIAIMEALMTPEMNFKESLLKWCRKYPSPMGGYGTSFLLWLYSKDPQPYNSYGNGAAMRVSPCAIAFKRRNAAIRAAVYSASVSHNHPEGILGAMATVDAIRRLLKFKTREQALLVENQYYPVDAKYVKGKFDETCQGTVPVALRIIQKSNDFEDAMRNTMEWGGDSDTLGAIVGPMAEALWGIPEDIEREAMSYLPEEMKIIVEIFYKKYML